MVAAKKGPARVPRNMALVSRVVDIIKDEGLQADLAPGSPRGRALDIIFSTSSGDEIGVEIGFTNRFASDRGVEAFLNRINLAFGPLRLREVLIVANGFPEEVQSTLDAYHGIEMVEITGFREWLRRRYKPRNAARPSRGRELRTNSERIVLAAGALAAQVDAKLTALREEKPNSPEAIAARNAAIAEYEVLKRRVDELQDAITKLSKNKVKDSVAVKEATTFGKGVANWWTKDHVSILSNGYSMGVFLSAVCLCSLVGVNPSLAAGVAGVLVGGKNVAGALKKLPKS